MIKTATRRFANRKAERNFDWVTFNKDGMDNARRALDKALIEEAMNAMLEPEPEKDYFAVEFLAWNDYDDEFDFGPSPEINDVFDNYNDAAKCAARCNGNIIPVSKECFDYQRKIDNDEWFWE